MALVWEGPRPRERERERQRVESAKVKKRVNNGGPERMGTSNERNWDERNYGATVGDGLASVGIKVGSLGWETERATELHHSGSQWVGKGERYALSTFPVNAARYR